MFLTGCNDPSDLAQSRRLVDFKVKRAFQAAFDALPYTSCADTNSLRRHIQEVTFSFHNSAVDDPRVDSLRDAIFDFLCAHRDGGLTNYLKWRAPEDLGWKLRDNAMASIRRELGSDIGFATPSNALVPYLSQRSRWTFYENFIDGACLDTNHLESLRSAAMNPGTMAGALLGVHVFTVNKRHPLLVAHPDAFNTAALMNQTIVQSLDIPPFLFETSYTLEKELGDHGTATAAYFYIAARSALHHIHGFPIIGQLHWVAEKNRWIWDYLTWGAYYPGRPSPKTNYVRSAF